jgi:hypothetical protein
MQNNKKCITKRKGEGGNTKKKEDLNSYVINDVADEAILFLVLEDPSRGRKSYRMEEPMMEV